MTALLAEPGSAATRWASSPVSSVVPRPKASVLSSCDSQDGFFGMAVYGGVVAGRGEYSACRPLTLSVPLIVVAALMPRKSMKLILRGNFSPAGSCATTSRQSFHVTVVGYSVVVRPSAPM